MEYQFCTNLWNFSYDTPHAEILSNARIWAVENNSDKLNIEEIRTIIGTKPQKAIFSDLSGNTIDVFDDGDELSENLYRAFENLPLRFGYGNYECTAKKAVVNNALEWVNSFVQLEHKIIIPDDYKSSSYFSRLFDISNLKTSFFSKLFSKVASTLRCIPCIQCISKYF
jgi:hypothetical protein